MIRLHKVKEVGFFIDFVRRSSGFADKMSEAFNQKKEEKTAFKKKEKYVPRYKRAWEKRQTDDASEEKRACLDNNAERIKRRKCAILMAYSGVNFFGMQRNPEMKTIEEELLKAMFKNEWINQDGFDQPQHYQFQRAARTDKGVSAMQQVVSMKLPDNLNIEAINLDLPDDIRIFGVKRVTKGFNSKNNCDARTYSYTLPTVAFADHKEEITDLNSFRIGEERLKRFNEVLKMYEGTLNFHNFTSRKEYADPSARRFIMSIGCDTPFYAENSGMEFAVIRVKGQSFMLHQIRKMIGLAIAIIRGHTEPSTITKALSSERIDIPMAPGLGLVLDKIHYEKYNHRYGSDGMHENLEWSEVESDLKDFFLKRIFKTILDAEIETKSMAGWLETLNRHSYDVRDNDRSNKDEKLAESSEENSKNSDG